MEESNAMDVEWMEEEQPVHLVAAVEPREVELERRLAELEARMAAMTVELAAASASAVAASATQGRKTLAAGVSAMLAKQGVSFEAGAGKASIEASALDGALANLGIEQRIAVKAELLRAGLLG